MRLAHIFNGHHGDRILTATEYKSVGCGEHMYLILVGPRVECLNFHRYKKLGHALMYCTSPQTQTMVKLILLRLQSMITVCMPL